MSKSRTGQAGGSAQQPRRQKSNVPSSSSSSRYGKSRQLNYDLDIDVNLIDDLFDQLDWYERALNLALPSYGQKRRGTQAVSQTRTRPTRPISSRRRATSMTSFQQQPFVGIKRQQGIQGRMPMQQQQFLQQKKSIKQPFLGGIGGGGLGSLGGGIDKSMLQKYRICIDCQSYGCDPKQVKTAIKCVNGQYHLTVCAPCKSDPALMLKRSFTLPGHVQRNKMIKQISPQGHCVIEFPLLEGPTFLNIPQLPPQKMKTPEGKKHLLLQVPIPVTMDPAKVAASAKDSTTTAANSDGAEDEQCRYFADEPTNNAHPKETKTEEATTIANTTTAAAATSTTTTAQVACFQCASVESTTFARSEPRSGSFGPGIRQQGANEADFNEHSDFDGQRCA